jgi:hypothetical protein
MLFTADEWFKLHRRIPVFMSQSLTVVSFEAVAKLLSLIRSTLFTGALCLKNWVTVLFESMSTVAD